MPFAIGEAADLIGIVGDTWTDDTGDRISFVYEPVQVYAWGVPAGDFMVAR